MSKRRFAKSAAGDELTPEVVEALAEEAKAGYDLSEARPVLVTHPLLGDAETMGRIVVRVSDEELNRLRGRAEAEERTIPSLVHEAAIRYLKSNGA